MSFFFRPAFHAESPIYSSFRPLASDDEAYYYRIAEEHQRRAEAALALAQQEERRRRRVAAQQSYYEEPHFRPEDRAEYAPTRPHHFRGPFDFPFDFHEPRYPGRYEHVPDIAQRSPPAPHSLEWINRDDHEHRLEEWFQRRRQHDLEEAQFRRSKEPERRRDDDLMQEMLAALGMDSMERNRPTPTATTSSLRPTTRPLDEELYHPTTPRQVPAHSQTRAWDGHIPKPQPTQASEPAFTSSTSSSLDFPTQLWNALSGGRSDKERANILQDLGLGVPFNVTHPSKTQQPTAEQRSSSAQRSAATPRSTAHQSHPQTPWPTPAPIPVIVRSPAPAQPKPSTSRNPSPTPVKLSPFAHIESIQTKFDSLRASTPDLSNPQKKREYLAELNKLLTSLDEVESSGSESIRGARKALVRAVEEELENVEGTQDEQKHEVAEEKQVEEAQVEAKREEKPSVVEAAPEPQASAEPVTQEVEIQSVSESEAMQIHPAEPTVEEPVDELAHAVGQHSEPEPQASSEQVPSADETRPEAPATLIDVNASAPVDAAKPEVNVDEEKTHVASRATEEQPQRGRQPTVPSQVPKSPRTRRPPSVEIEEVPDEESLSGSPQVGYRDL